MAPSECQTEPRFEASCVFSGVPGAAVGTITSGFELVSFLGRGGMADVYAARSEATGAPFALKRMLPWLAKRRRLVELFFHEARVCSALCHPNIVRGIDVGVDDDVPFLVLELVDGSTCKELMYGLGAFPLGVAVSVAHQVLMGLAHAHEACDRDGRALRVVHNDVTPDNVVISHLGQAKLLDFGVAHSELACRAINAAEFRGKIGYASPEHLAGLPIDARADLFAVGVLLAEMLRGRPLFASRDRFEVAVAAFNADVSALGGSDLEVPEPLRNVLRTALARDRDRRFGSARDFGHALEQAASQSDCTCDSDQIGDWLESREPSRASAVGVRREAAIEPSPELDAKIKVAQDEIQRRSTTLSAGRANVRSATVIVPRIATQRYRVKTGPHAEVRRLSHAEVVAGIVTRSLDTTTLIAESSEPWMALGEIPGFSALLKMPAYRAVLGRIDWRMPVERRELPRILFQIAVARERGMLEARSGPRWKRIFFDGGAPVFVASNDRTELLGNHARRQGAIAQRQLDALISFAFFQGRRLGDVIVAAKLMDPAEMLRLLVLQLEARVLELGTWAGGELCFTRGARPGFSTPKPLGSPVRLPCSLVRSSYRDEEIETFLQPLAAAPVQMMGPMSKLDDVLTEDEACVLARLSTPQTIPGLIKSLAGQSSELVRRSVFLGLSAGVLECNVSTSA